MSFIVEGAAKLVSFIPGELAEKLAESILRHRMSRIEQIEFLKNYSKLKADGFKDRKTLEAMYEEYSESLGEDSNEARFCIEALKGLEEGSIGIDDAMRRWFDPDLSQVIRASTVSENGLLALTKLLKQVDAWQAVKKEIREESRKPLGWISAGIGGTLIVATKGISAAAGDIPREEWSSIAQMYDSLGGWIMANGNMLLLLVGMAVATYMYFMHFYDGPSRGFMDRHVPGFGFYQAGQASRFFSVMSVLISPECGKMRLKQALDEFEDNNDLITPYLGLHIDEMLSRTEQGRFALEQLDTGLLPPRMRVRLGIAGKTSDGTTMAATFDDISENLADDYGAVIIKKIKGSMTLVKFVSTILLIGAFSAGLDAAFARVDAML